MCIYFASIALLGYCLFFAVLYILLALLDFNWLCVFWVFLYFCHWFIGFISDFAVLFILPYYYRFFLSDHCWRRLFIAFGYFRAIVGFTCHCYNAAVLLTTLTSRYTRNGGKDIFFFWSWKITTEGLSTKIIRAILNSNLSRARKYRYWPED